MTTPIVASSAGYGCPASASACPLAMVSSLEVVTPDVFSLPQPANSVDARNLLGPERSLTVSFKPSRLPSLSLRLLPAPSWAKVLAAAGFEVLSVVESGAVAPVAGGREKKQSSRSSKRKGVTNGVTGFNMAGASVFVSDKTFTLQARGHTQSPLDLLEPVLDLAFPSWRRKHPSHYLRYVQFNQLAIPSPADATLASATWQQEVERLNQYFQGEDVTLGSKSTATLGVYVASYLQKDDFADFFSTQVSLSDVVEPDAESQLFGRETPLEASWSKLHGSEPRSVAAKAQLDTRRFAAASPGKGRACSTLGVYGLYFTRALSFAAQADSPVAGFSVETSMPMNGERRLAFMSGASGICRAGVLTIAEFSLSPSLLPQGDAPEMPGFDIRQSSRTMGVHFGCSLYHYVRSTTSVLPSPVQARAVVHRVATNGTRTSAAQCASAAGFPAIAPAATVDVDMLEKAPLRAAEMFLASGGTTGAKPGAVVRVLTPEEQEAVAMAPPTDAPVALLDLSALRRRAELWRGLLPRVEPFYAVKCNPHDRILAALWELWQEFGVGGFDCASPAEMKLVKALEPRVCLKDRVVYANPCKQETAVAYARAVGVNRMTFDNVAELDKIQRLYPDSELLLRVQTDDSLAQCPLSNKFGCAPVDCARLLASAVERGLKVIGVSFHVGSGCSQVGAFRSALRRAREAFNEAERVGFQPWLLDIGGGFPGWDEENEATFADHAADISEVLEELFPSPGVRVIAEPGRFFAATAQALLTTVVSVADAAEGDRYYLNDGLYGSFNCVLYDHAQVPQATILRDGKLLPPEEEGEYYPCTVFGPTCDGFDVVSDKLRLPRLKVGDRLLFRNMGAYTNAASTTFNGFAPADSFIYASRLTTSRS